MAGSRATAPENPQKAAHRHFLVYRSCGGRGVAKESADRISRRAEPLHHVRPLSRPPGQMRAEVSFAPSGLELGRWRLVRHRGVRRPARSTGGRWAPDLFLGTIASTPDFDRNSSMKALSRLGGSCFAVTTPGENRVTRWDTVGERADQEIDPGNPPGSPLICWNPSSDSSPRATTVPLSRTIHPRCPSIAISLARCRGAGTSSVGEIGPGTHLRRIGKSAPGLASRARFSAFDRCCIVRFRRPFPHGHTDASTAPGPRGSTRTTRPSAISSSKMSRASSNERSTGSNPRRTRLGDGAGLARPRWDVASVDHGLTPRSRRSNWATSARCVAAVPKPVASSHAAVQPFAGPAASRAGRER
jgi:hypothetical protein